MVADPRIKSYRQAAQAMKAGNFSIQIPVITEGEDDEVGQLGVELSELGNVLERRRREMRELLRVTERINAGLILEDVLNYVFDNFRPIIPFDRIGFSLLDECTETVRALWARSDVSEIAIGAGYSAPLRGSSLEGIIETGQPRILNDLVEYLKQHPNSDSTRKIVSEGIRSSLTCPLITQSKPVGFMFFSSRQPNTYKSVHVEVFQQIAGQLSVIVEKGRLYQELLELNQLKNRFLGIAAHDLRSPLTVVKGYAGLLVNGIAGEITDRQKDVVGRMAASCDRMLALINDLLNVSAIEAGKLVVHIKDVDLGGFLRE
ncbi:MAG: histidine kinase dimerization/phospho-acceptor domain-containing protein, partial [bacterium]